MIFRTVTVERDSMMIMSCLEVKKFTLLATISLLNLVSGSSANHNQFDDSQNHYPLAGSVNPKLLAIPRPFAPVQLTPKIQPQQNQAQPVLVRQDGQKVSRPKRLGRRWRKSRKRQQIIQASKQQQQPPHPSGRLAAQDPPCNCQTNESLELIREKVNEAQTKIADAEKILGDIGIQLSAVDASSTANLPQPTSRPHRGQEILHDEYDEHYDHTGGGNEHDVNEGPVASLPVLGSSQQQQPMRDTGKFHQNPYSLSSPQSNNPNPIENPGYQYHLYKDLAAANNNPSPNPSDFVSQQTENSDPTQPPNHQQQYQQKARQESASLDRGTIADAERSTDSKSNEHDNIRLQQPPNTKSSHIEMEKTSSSNSPELAQRNIEGAPGPKQDLQQSPNVNPYNSKIRNQSGGSPRTVVTNEPDFRQVTEARKRDEVRATTQPIHTTTNNDLDRSSTRPPEEAPLGAENFNPYARTTDSLVSQSDCSPSVDPGKDVAYPSARTPIIDPPPASNILFRGRDELLKLASVDPVEPRPLALPAAAGKQDLPAKPALATPQIVSITNAPAPDSNVDSPRVKDSGRNVQQKTADQANIDISNSNQSPAKGKQIVTSFQGSTSNTSHEQVKNQQQTVEHDYGGYVDDDDDYDDNLLNDSEPHGSSQNHQPNKLERANKENGSLGLVKNLPGMQHLYRGQPTVDEDEDENDYNDDDDLSEFEKRQHGDTSGHRSQLSSRPQPIIDGQHPRQGETEMETHPVDPYPRHQHRHASFFGQNQHSTAQRPGSHLTPPYGVTPPSPPGLRSFALPGANYRQPMQLQQPSTVQLATPMAVQSGGERGEYVDDDDDDGDDESEEDDAQGELAGPSHDGRPGQKRKRGGRFRSFLRQSKRKVKQVGHKVIRSDYLLHDVIEKTKYHAAPHVRSMVDQTRQAGQAVRRRVSSRFHRRGQAQNVAAPLQAGSGAHLPAPPLDALALARTIPDRLGQYPTVPPMNSMKNNDQHFDTGNLKATTPDGGLHRQRSHHESVSHSSDGRRTSFNRRSSSFDYLSSSSSSPSPSPL